MPLIEWKADYDTGHPDLDADHRKLADLVNTVYDAWAQGRELGTLAVVFDQLVDYTDYHFKREERILEELGYARLDEQKAEHEVLRNMAQQFRDNYLAGADPAPFTPEIREFLRTWLMGHILEEDMKYRSLVSDAASKD